MGPIGRHYVSIFFFFFLNLEKRNSVSGLETVLINDQETSDTNAILAAITDFYGNLYAMQDHHTMQEMINFLGQIPSLPWVIQDTTALTMPITSLEISDAIASL